MTQTTEQNQSPLIEADVIDTSHNSDSERVVTINEAIAYYDNLPTNLLQKALEKIDSNHAKVRTLYRSQLFVELEHENIDLGVADGSDIALIQVLSDELKELKAIISKALAQLEAE
jgi:hypothetical protein